MYAGLGIGSHHKVSTVKAEAGGGARRKEGVVEK